jgi:hypothetical protein
MQSVQTVRTAKPVARGDMWPTLAFRRNAATVGASASWPYQYDTHHCSMQVLTATVMGGIGRASIVTALGLCAEQPMIGSLYLPRGYPPAAGRTQASQ